MALKKKSRVSAEFSMSSLTDIIFLLLIFFMLTSSIIIPNALNLKLPSSTGASKSITRPNQVEIRANGVYIYNGNQLNEDRVEDKIRELAKSGKTLSIAPNPKVDNQYVVRILDMALKHQVSTALVEPDH